MTQKIRHVNSMRKIILFLGIFMSTNANAYENVFYCTYQNNECIESNNAINVNESDMIEH